MQFESYTPMLHALQFGKQNQRMFFSRRWPSETSPFVSSPTMLILSDCGSPGSIATMLGRCSEVMPVVTLAKEGETCEIGDIVSSSEDVCTIGRRMQCDGMSDSSSKQG
jgi:hypothetical protein